MSSTTSTHNVTIELNEPPVVVIERVKLAQRLAGLLSVSFDTKYGNLARHYADGQDFLYGIEITSSANKVEFVPTIQVKFNTVDDTLFITDFESVKSEAGSRYVATGVIKLNFADVEVRFVVTNGEQEVEATITLLD